MSDTPHAQARPAAPPSDAAAPTVPSGEALRFWLKLGFISFGGPAGQIAIMHSELVQRRRWISERRFLHALNYCMVLPGPEAQQLATYIGWLMHRTWGGLIAGGLFVLPSLFILIGLSWLYMAHGNLGWVQGLFWGIKPAVVAVIAFAGWRLGSKVLRAPLAWALALASFAALLAGVAFPWVIAAAALVGVFTAQHWAPASHAPAGGANADTGGHVIDDHTPPPAHARFAPRHLALLLAVGAALWLVPMAVLTALYGWQGALTQMGWFFTKVALLTFGGAYAVLPYVYQGAVDHYGWLTATQMIDGLALGETTPGPLIMVVAFVGYVGGWGAAEQLAASPAAAGALAASVVTFFTFLPSFLFILIGGPLVESGRQQHRLTAPLAAVSAAVVGGIAKLAVFFAGAVLWAPAAADARYAATLAIAAAAGVALFVFKRSVIEVIAAAAVLGVLLHAVLG